MKQLRKILFPFSGIYYIITLTRNILYDRGLFTSRAFDFPVVCIGNLSTGGTGKSPMTEYVIRLLKDDFKLATLSRGYGRKTKGYKLVQATSMAENVGDEPLQFAQKFQDVDVAVCEDRKTGVATLRENTMAEVIILDDAFQHRKVTAGYNILLTTYGDLYSNDYVLPAGNLREPRVGAQRAQAIVVTKCPAELSGFEKDKIVKSLNPLPHQEVFFSTITYSDIIFSIDSDRPLSSLENQNFTLVTGIANPAPLVDYLQSLGLKFEHKKYGDHHVFAQSELKLLEQQQIILTTEKDYMRLQHNLNHRNMYYLPIQTKFLENGERFDAKLKDAVSLQH